MLARQPRSIMLRGAGSTGSESEPRVVAKNEPKLPAATGERDVDAFLRQIAAAPVQRNTIGVGRLIFALDATASRQPTWDHACQIQAEMFSEAGAVGGLAIQLCW